MPPAGIFETQRSRGVSPSLFPKYSGGVRAAGGGRAPFRRPRLTPPLQMVTLGARGGGDIRMTALWRGTFATRLRIASGLILFIYAGLHFLNIALGPASLEVMHAAQDWRLAVTRSLPGTVLVYGALIAHAGLALARLAGRRTVRMPFWEAFQIALGLAIPFLLAAHIVFTRAAHELFAVNDRMVYLVALIFGTPDAWWQSALMLIVWTHGCLGLHVWLRTTPRWRRLRLLPKSRQLCRPCR